MSTVTSFEHEFLTDSPPNRFHVQTSGSFATLASHRWPTRRRRRLSAGPLTTWHPSVCPLPLKVLPTGFAVDAWSGALCPAMVRLPFFFFFKHQQPLSPPKKKTHTHTDIGKPADVFGFGVLAWEVWAQRRPFAGVDRRTSFVEPCGPIHDTWPLAIQQLIAACMEFDVADRFGMGWC